MGSPAVKCHECSVWIFESSGEFYEDDGHLTIHTEERCSQARISSRGLQGLFTHLLEQVSLLTVRVNDLTRRLNALDGKEE